MQNGKKLFFVTAACFAAITCVAFASTVGANVAKGLSLLTIRGLGSGPMVLNQDATPTIVDGDGEYELNEFAHFAYTKASNLDGYHVVLEEGGTLQKNEASKGITSVTAVFEGQLRFECGYAEDYESSEVVYMVELTSGSASEVDGNYWKITALENTKITSISISYSCEDESESEGIVDHDGIVGIQNKAQFIDVVKENDTIYATIDCTYDNTKGRVKASDLVLYGDNASIENFTCERIETSSPTTFKAYFDVSSKHSQIKGAAAQTILYCHLKVDGVAWNSGNGNVSTSSNVVVTRYQTVSGNKTISVKMRDTGTRLALLVFETNNICDYITSFGKNPENKNNDGNPFANLNGGDTSCSTYAKEGPSDTTTLWRYANTQGKTFKVSIVSNKATNAQFSLVTSGRDGKILSYNQVGEASDRNPYITSMTLNGSSDGVAALDNQTTFGNFPSTSMTTWFNYLHAPLATLSLNEGLNVLEFAISNNDGNQNQLNMSGVSFDLEDDDAEINLYHDYDLNYSPSLTGTSITTPMGEFNPFIKDNGGSVTGTPQVEENNFKYESGQLYRYGENLGYTFTTTLRVNKAVTVKFGIKISGNNNRAFSATEASVSADTNYAYIASATLDGKATGVTLSTERYAMTGWTSYLSCDVMTLELHAGLNVVAFRLLGKQATRSNSKVNLRGILIESSTPVKLGAK